MFWDLVFGIWLHSAVLFFCGVARYLEPWLDVASCKY
jgi:hypothetical protein